MERSSDWYEKLSEVADGVLRVIQAEGTQLERFVEGEGWHHFDEGEIQEIKERLVRFLSCKFTVFTLAGPDTDEATEGEESKHITRTLLGNLDMGPLLAGTFYGRYLRGIEDALKKSAEADLVRTIIAGMTFVEEQPGTDWTGDILNYLKRMRELAASLYSEDEEPESEKDEETEEESV